MMMISPRGTPGLYTCTSRRYHRAMPAFSTVADVSTYAFWAQPPAEREHAFGLLREHDPVSWQPPVAWPLPQPFEGFWAVTRHEDITHVSKHPEIFCSSRGISMEPLPPEFERDNAFFLAMDAPEHARLRKLIASAFTPRRVKATSEGIEVNARSIVAEFAALVDSDVVADLSAKLPQVTFFDMMGVPAEDRPRVSALFAASEDAEVFMQAADPLALAAEFNGRLTEYGRELAARRRVDPADDLMTALVEADVDGERLNDVELGAAMILLSIAGTDTTKQTTTHAVHALAAHPEQRRWLLDDLDGRLNMAVEELIRWSTAINQFSRVATVDTELGGREIRAGEKVTMIYRSGNRDGRVFHEPHALDLGRTPNLHVGFGGGGVHFCLGAHVARAELRILLRELLTHAPDLEVGEPTWSTTNSLINAIGHLPAHNPSPR